jgi:hypothetical protein
MSVFANELLYKEIVFSLNETIKILRKKSFFKESKEEKLNSHILKKVSEHWPLKKGSVGKNILAWNCYDLQPEVVNAFLAFALKSLGVSLEIDNLSWQEICEKQNFNSSTDELKSFDYLFQHKGLTSLFWSDIKKYYQLYTGEKLPAKTHRVGAVEKKIPRNSCVALCLDAVFFRIRSGSNQELTSFEFFIEDCYNANNSLIIFSQQKLIHPAQNSLQINNYSVSYKMNKDILKSSIYEALEPQSHLIQSQRFIEAQKTGCFDRLIHLLTLGQNYVESVESSYTQHK